MIRTRRAKVLVGVALLMASCAPTDPYYTNRDPHVYGSRKENRNTGIGLGLVSGGIIGNNTGLGTVGGAAIGGVLGGILGDTAGGKQSRNKGYRSTSSGNLQYRHY